MKSCAGLVHHPSAMPQPCVAISPMVRLSAIPCRRSSAWAPTWYCDAEAPRAGLPLDEFYLDYRKTALQPSEFVQAVRDSITTGNRQAFPLTTRSPNATIRISRRFAAHTGYRSRRTRLPKRASATAAWPRSRKGQSVAKPHCAAAPGTKQRSKWRSRPCLRIINR